MAIENKIVTDLRIERDNLAEELSNSITAQIKAFQQRTGLIVKDISIEVNHSFIESESMPVGTTCGAQVSIII